MIKTTKMQPPDEHWIHVKSLDGNCNTEVFYTIDDCDKHISDNPVFLHDVRTSGIDCTWKWNGRRNWNIECREYPVRFDMAEWSSFEDFIRGVIAPVAPTKGSSNRRFPKTLPELRSSFSVNGEDSTEGTIKIERTKSPPAIFIVTVTITHPDSPEYKKLCETVKLSIQQFVDVRCCDECRYENKYKLTEELVQKLVNNCE